ncbi:beta-1,3-galactosyltransferase 2-like [Spea bombifrons]|uniref:beta-1,3-galactosyltransferase 2-like n=1 Tax=Spea bombifrons TaxID=233779 RepID=UPI00234A8B5E|nr:beta-1,3-galactosyltransferase 2-like [Spea bombifrons]
MIPFAAVLKSTNFRMPFPKCTSKITLYFVAIYVLIVLSLLTGYLFYNIGIGYFPVYKNNTVKIVRALELKENNQKTPTSKSKGYLNITLFPYIINEPYKCKDRKPFLILLITTVASGIEHREAIRSTWGNESIGDEKGLTIIRLFLLGVDNNENSSATAKESDMYHDIIQRDFQDTYKNLSIKTIMGIDWVSTYCPDSKYIMKTDSDMFVNVERLLTELEPELPPKQNFFTGFLMKNPVPHRNKESKWYVPPSDYPDKTYPDFCSGTGYVFSEDMVPKILRSSFKIKYFYLEDVFVALCLQKAGFKIASTQNSLFFNYRVKFEPCVYYKLITSHGLDPKDLFTYWKTMQEKKMYC